MTRLSVDDFVVLGRTVPEDSKKFGKKVCMSGYSSQLSQFPRVYPLMLPIGENYGTNQFKARHAYSLELRRNPDETRQESWRVGFWVAMALQVLELTPVIIPCAMSYDVVWKKCKYWLSQCHPVAANSTAKSMDPIFSRRATMHEVYKI